MKKLRFLLACEESQAVTIELRKLGHEAYSCDILPCSGGYPSWHLQRDVRELLLQKWDVIIAFPPCTFLTTTGNRWFNIERYGEKAIKRHEERKEAIKFFKLLANADCDFIAIENPVGVMSTHWRKPDQVINPYQFGDAFEKRTCLWLKGLPKLETTNVIVPQSRIEFESGRTMAKWYAETCNLPKDERVRLRSKTFSGIAKAMALQWSNFVVATRIF